MMVFFWLLAIGGGVYLISELSRRKREEEKEKMPKALEILKERYAKGEINTEEYEAKKRELAS
ncbi:MAG: SHOCT domain-containing protein [Actinomycetota bacterium]|nr:SHOCT domain-containing protein [Actinomycetota bacterium]